MLVYDTGLKDFGTILYGFAKAIMVVPVSLVITTQPTTTHSEELSTRIGKVECVSMHLLAADTSNRYACIQ